MGTSIMMKRVVYPYKGSVTIWRDIVTNHTYVMIFASTKREPNWGINPQFLLDLWKLGTKSLSIDMVPPGVTRTHPDRANLINRQEFMKIMSRFGLFDDHLGFYRVLCGDTIVDRTNPEHDMLPPI